MTTKLAGQPALCTRERAQALTEEIRQSHTRTWKLLAEAVRVRAWEALGYENWDAYVAAQFSDLPRLPRAKRKAAVASLKGDGLSIGVIAGITGASRSQVHRDLAESGDAPADVITGRDGRRVKVTNCGKRRGPVWNWVQVRFAVKPDEHKAILKEAAAAGLGEIDYVRRCFDAGRNLLR